MDIYKNNIDILRLRVEEKIRINQDRAKEYVQKIGLLTERIQEDKTSLNIRITARDSEISNLDSMKTLQMDLEKIGHAHENGISKSLDVSL